MRSTFVLSLLCLTVLASAGCDEGPPPEPRTAFGLYDLDGPASCVVTPMDAPDEPFSIVGEIEVAEPGEDDDPACERVLDLRIETCPGCTPSPCRMCLSGVTDVDGVMSATLIGDPALFAVAPACQLQDGSGEAASRIYVDGRAVSGTVSTAEDGTGEVLLSLMGTSARGISGANRTSTIACTIDVIRREGL
jgi:hypothetical protein